MRKILILATMLALAGCGGGGGGSTPQQPPLVPTTAPQSDLVTPTFTINIPPRTSSMNGRAPQRVSPAANSITISRTTQPTVTPTYKTTDLTALMPCPCTVSGPPSPPGVSNTFTFQTFASTNGSGIALDLGTLTLTPSAGSNNAQSVALMGIPFSVTIAPLTTQTVDTAGQTQSVSVTVKDNAGQTIVGTYANFVTITDPDPATYGASIKGTSLSGTHAGACTTSCVILQTNTDTATLTYNGLAEDPITLTSSATGVTGGNAGTATFTPTLHAIFHTSGGNSTIAGNPVGIDLYTTDNTSPAGYSGTEGYHEDGYTDAPYNKVLTTIDGTSCAAFATLGAANVSNDTVFTATAIASPSAGSCTRVVSDGLAAVGHGINAVARAVRSVTPTKQTFVVTYTTSSVSASAKHRKN